MKKLVLVLVFAVCAQFSTFAQDQNDRRLKGNVDKYIEKVEKNTTLTTEEKEKVFEIKAEHTKSYWKMMEDQAADSDKQDETKKEINKTFMTSLIKAFGRERAVEIAKASQGK
ncbi:hypothetical protein N9B67_02785 [Algibacter sp.]|nr:hypothetical protein [Algibacter sp.]MDC1321771.1 hypothetical protein [bacterium]